MNDKNLKNYKYFSSFIVLLLLLIKIYLILNNYIDTSKGDGSSYIWDSLLGVGRFFNNITGWLSIHPPISFISGSLIFECYKIFDLFEIISYVKFALIINSFLFLISSIFVYLIIKKSLDERIALIGLIFYSTAGLLQIVTLNGSAEIYAVVFLLSSLYFFICYINNNNKKWIIYTAILFLLSSMCRTEILLLAPVVFIFVISRGNIFHAILFGCIISSFEIFKLIMKYFILDDASIGYETAKNLWVIKKNTLDYILFDSKMMEYFLSSYNIYFTILIIVLSVILIFKSKYRFFIIIFIYFSSILLILQYLGKIPDNDRYVFFQVVLFVFVIACIFHYILNKWSILRKYYLYIFIGVVLLSSNNFYLGITDKLSRVSKTNVDTYSWVRKNLKINDYVFLDFMNYLSVNFGLHLSTKFISAPEIFQKQLFNYNVGYKFTMANNFNAIKFNAEIYNFLDKNYVEQVLGPVYVKSNSLEFLLRQKIAGEFFIKQFNPRFFVIPKNSFQKYIKLSFIKDKMIPFKKKSYYVKLEYVDFSFFLNEVYENKDFMVFEADYGTKQNLHEIEEVKKNIFKLKNSGNYFGNLIVSDDNCLKHVIVSVGYRDKNIYKTAKYIYYYLYKGNNILSLDNMNLRSKSTDFSIDKITDLVVYYYLYKEKTINKCVNKFTLFKLKGDKNNAI